MFKVNPLAYEANIVKNTYRLLLTARAAEQTIRQADEQI